MSVDVYFTDANEPDGEVNVARVGDEAVDTTIEPGDAVKLEYLVGQVVKVSRVVPITHERGIGGRDRRVRSARPPARRQPPVRGGRADRSGALEQEMPRAGRRPGAVRHHPRLLRLARARRDRLRSGPRRSVRHPRRRQHRRALAGRQRRVRRVPLTARSSSSSWATRSAAPSPPPSKNCSMAPPTSRATCARSSIACGRRSTTAIAGRRDVVDRTTLVREAVRANVRTSVDHLRHAGRRLLEKLVQNEGPA